MSKAEDIEALRKLEEEQNPAGPTGEKGRPGVDGKNDEPFFSGDETDRPNMLDGYKILENYDLPQQGKLYPDAWTFAYRCPEAKEVANFSTINEQDQPAIIIAIEDLIRRCVVIYDTDRNRKVSTGEICDCHRTYFLLKLREFYLPESPIQYPGVCSLCHEPKEIQLFADLFEYDDISVKLLEAFDGRKFSLNMPGVEEPIEFLVPTIELSTRIFKYLVRAYRENSSDRETKNADKIVYDKQFLLMAPYLYETGKESIKELGVKYKTIQKDENLFKAYLEIVTKLKLDNSEFVNSKCEACGSEEEAQIRFPGGWKNMFVSKKSTSGYFD